MIPTEKGLALGDGAKLGVVRRADHDHRAVKRVCGPLVRSEEGDVAEVGVQPGVFRRWRAPRGCCGVAPAAAVARGGARIASAVTQRCDWRKNVLWDGIWVIVRTEGEEQQRRNREPHAA